MALLTKHSLDLATINPPANPLAPVGDKRFSDQDERNLYTAYKAHLEIAHALSNSKPPLYQDAWINLNLSVECFLKHIYCLP